MLRQVLDSHELLDSAAVDGATVQDFLSARGIDARFRRVEEGGASTDFVRILIPGSDGKSSGGEAPTLGIIGRLGGIGARPERTGMVSDADGATVALACGLKLHSMAEKGDRLPGDVVLTTHICPTAPIIPHDPVPFMDSPVSTSTMNANEVEAAMDGILVVDTTKGNRILNHRGFAVAPTIKQGYILRTPDVLIDTVEWTTGQPAHIMPIVTQDITPYGNGLDHVNSLLQPATVTDAPVVGVAITAETVVPGSATGASREVDLESAARFCIEVAKLFSTGATKLYDPDEFDRLNTLYGSMERFQA